MNIAVIGSGNIGGTLARKWAVAGHKVVIGGRDPAKADLQQLVADIGANARAATIEHAIQVSDVVLFAVPGAAMGATVEHSGRHWPASWSSMRPITLARQSSTAWRP